MSGVRPRLAEVVASLSLATDLLMGQPMDHGLRSCLLAIRLGDRAGLSSGELAEVYWVSLLAWIGCTADPHELAEHFGDDIEVFGSAYGVDLAGMSMLKFLAKRAGAGKPPLERARQLVWLVTSVSGWAKESFAGKCEIAEDLSARLGMNDRIRERLQEVYERWDGEGMPRSLKGEQIAASVRVFQLAEMVEVHHRLGGVDAAVHVARERAGAQFDPSLVALFETHAAELLGALDDAGAWDAVMAADPEAGLRLADGELDRALEVVADFVSMKSPFLATHSRGVASLAADAARRCGLADDDARMLMRAGLVHDIGRIGVSNAIWDKPGPLNDGERERVRLHAYFTERILSRSSLAPIGAVASMHHERCDGSGYHRASDASALPMTARLLAAADAYHAMLEERPHRAALSRDAAAGELRSEARAGRLDGRAVDAVLDAAGHRVAKRGGWPSGLSDREVEVLRLITRGLSKRDVARTLSISPATADHHIRHIYTKTGVATRAAATLFAMRHALLE